MKCQILFSRKNKKNKKIFENVSAEIFTQKAKLKILNGLVQLLHSKASYLSLHCLL